MGRGGVSADLWEGALIEARIWHARRGDHPREFRYNATYISAPVAEIDAGTLPVPVDAPGLWRLRKRDYGARDGGDLTPFIRDVLARHDMDEASEVTLLTLPRTPFYGFNPVSFWLCRDSEKHLRGVLAEVSNTFGERHCYLVRRPDGGAITPSDRLEAEKLFHVSPFLPRAGRYRFRFDAGPGRFGAWIDWLGPDGIELGTAMTGPATALTRSALRRAALRSPFQAQKVIGLIHWQAAKLFARGARYRGKPEQRPERISATGAQGDG